MNHEALRAEVCRVNREIVRAGLVVLTWGNASAADRAAGVMAIKPSGVDYDALRPEDIVVLALDDGRVVEGALRPSSDTPTHLHLYRAFPSVGGVVHTHSTYATAWSARRQPIPCCTTMQADEFGGDIPVGPLALIGDEQIGRGIVDTLASSRSKAVLMANHGPFTVGTDARDAVKVAVMLEEVARCVHLSSQLGEPIRLDQDMVDAIFDRYQNVYGQRKAAS